jgi:hypothetical protein
VSPIWSRSEASVAQVTGEEAARWFRGAWLRELFVGPLALILAFGFLLIRDMSGPTLRKIDGYWVFWGLYVVAGLVVQAQRRCPSCRRYLAYRAMNARQCSKCGTSFARVAWSASARQPGLFGWLESIGWRTSVGIVWGLCALAVAFAPLYVLTTAPIPDAAPLPAASGSASTTPLTYDSYVDTVGGFIFDHPADWTVESNVDPTKADTLIVIANHPNAGGFMGVTKAAESYTWQERAELERGIEDGWRDLYEDVAFVSRWQEITLAGLSGIRATITFHKDGQHIVATSVYLWHATYVYVLAFGAFVEQWSARQGEFERFFSSFTVIR